MKTDEYFMEVDRMMSKEIMAEYEGTENLVECQSCDGKGCYPSGEICNDCEGNGEYLIEY